MRIEVGGIQYTNFTTASCELRLDSLSSSFSFEAITPDGQALPFKGGDPCRIFVDNELALTGFIEIAAPSLTADDDTTTVSGRDKTADLLDSTLVGLDDIRGDNLTLKSLIEQVIAHLGLDIQVVDKVNPKPFSAAEDVAAPEPGENAFSFIQKYSKKRQVLLTSDAQGNVVIDANSGTQADGAIQYIIGADDNNVIGRNYSFNLTGRFYKYVVKSDLSIPPLNQAGDTAIEEISNQDGIAFDTEIRKSRVLTIIPDATFSSINCQDRAKWEANVRRARSMPYSATVKGFRVGGQGTLLWQINKRYQIVDQGIGKIEPMLCNSITFSFDAEDGRQTALGFVGKDAYTLLIEPDPLVTEASNVA